MVEDLALTKRDFADSIRLDISSNPVRLKFLTKDNRIINQDDTFGTNWVGDEVTTYKLLQDGEKFIGLGEKTGGLDRRGSVLAFYVAFDRRDLGERG